MHGAGNDYIYIDCITQPLSFTGESEAALAIRLSDRHFGIGSDGLVLILPSDTADLRMRMFNADGSEAQMCGNASRCVARYAYDHGLVHKETFTLETLAGVKTLAPLLSPLEEGRGTVTPDTLFSVDMGEPKIIEAPLLSPLEGKISEIAPTSFPLYSATISMGNPHAVFFVGCLDEVDVHGLGRAIEHDSLFPERTNVEFVEIISPTEVRMRVWERGSGETLACGTGACAVCVAGSTLGLTERHITLHLLGGDLHVNWQADNHVILTGPAEYAFTGEIEI